jgi:DNA-binding response OmpR family regulator
MNTRNNILEVVPPSGRTPPRNKTFPNRILVVDSNSDLLTLYIDALAGPEIQIDVAENSAAAWEALRANTYDLLFAENDVPDRIGDELVTKLRAARMAVPVVIAAGKLSMPESSRYHPCPFAATLLKPFELAVLQNTIKKALRAAVPIPLLQASLPKFAQAQNVRAALNILAPRSVMTLSAHGKCDGFADGTKWFEIS